MSRIRHIAPTVRDVAASNTTLAGVTGVENGAHRRALARELLASALYVALVLLAALIAVPADRLPPDADMVWLMLGTAIGLLLAHWLAFRLAARITAEDGGWTPSAAQEAAAQLMGGLAVAVLAAAPFLVLDGTAARRRIAADSRRAAGRHRLPDRPAPWTQLGFRVDGGGTGAGVGGRRRRREERPGPLASLQQWRSKGFAPQPLHPHDARGEPMTSNDVTAGRADSVATGEPDEQLENAPAAVDRRLAADPDRPCTHRVSAASSARCSSSA